MNILISNDDGVLAPGIAVLERALSTLGHVTVMAPERNQSGASNSLSLLRPLRVRQLENGYYSVDGTPTDCVHLALTGFFDHPFDIVVSGVNEGANLGDDILYSGTVAAAMEGRNLGLPAIAISLAGEEMHHFDTGAKVAKALIQKLLPHRLSIPKQNILNVNVPNVPYDALKGNQITRLGTRHMASPAQKAIDPRGRSIYWVGPPGLEADSGPGTDFCAITEGYVSITPLHCDMTHYTIFSQLEKWIQ